METFNLKEDNVFFLENLKIHPIKNRKHFCRKFIENLLSMCKSRNVVVFMSSLLNLKEIRWLRSDFIGLLLHISHFEEVNDPGDWEFVWTVWFDRSTGCGLRS